MAAFLDNADNTSPVRQYSKSEADKKIDEVIQYGVPAT
jgi:hypothetical protein